MKIIKFLLFCILLSISYNFIYATGPSYINSEIRPISINEKGEVLCRTRFQKNPMGNHDYMDIEYGLCVLTKDAILPLSVHILSYYADSLDGDTYMQRRHLYDSIFTTVCFNSDVILELKQLSLRNKYDFKECNISLYEKNIKLSLSEFKRINHINLLKIPQHALHGGLGYYKENKDINILYDFGNIIITQNIMEEVEQTGAIFDYLVPLFGGIEYELSKITGVIFLDRKK